MCVFVCGRHCFQQTGHELGMVANNPLCGQLKRGNEISPSQFAPERLVLRELCPLIMLSAVSPLIILRTQAESSGHWNETLALSPESTNQMRNLLYSQG